MADLATPSAAAISPGDQAPSTKATKNVVQKPEKPDQAAFKKAEEKAKKELDDSQEKLRKHKEKLSNRPNNKDSPSGKRREEIKAELNEIRAKQSGTKNSRSAVFDQIKRLDEQLKSRSAELKTARGNLKFKSPEEIDQQIAKLQKEVDTGYMKLVDEKKALAEVSSLNKQKKNFSGFDAQEKAIQDIKAQIAEKKKQLDDPEQKALSDRYSALKKEDDAIHAEGQASYKNFNALKDEETKLRNIQQEKYAALKKLRDEYHTAYRAAKDYEQEAYRIRQAKRKEEDDAYHAKKRKERAEARLEEASAPAYGDEILTAEGLIRYFDPSAVEAKAQAGPRELLATSQRTVDDSAFKGARVVKKEEEDYFAGTGGKKGKKGKKGGAAATPTDSGKLNLNIGILEDLAKVGVSPPGSQAQVPDVVKQLKEKLEHWKKDQDRKTKENIAKAEKEIEKLNAEGEAEGSRDAATKPSQKNQGVNGKVDAEAELTQEKEGVDDAAKELEKAKIEDGEGVVTAES